MPAASEAAPGDLSPLSAIPGFRLGVPPFGEARRLRRAQFAGALQDYADEHTFSAMNERLAVVEAKVENLHDMLVRERDDAVAFRTELRGSLSSLTAAMSQSFDAVGSKIDAMHGRVDGLGAQVGKIEAATEGLKATVAELPRKGYFAKLIVWTFGATAAIYAFWPTIMICLDWLRNKAPQYTP